MKTFNHELVITRSGSAIEDVVQGCNGEVEAVHQAPVLAEGVGECADDDERHSQCEDGCEVLFEKRVAECSLEAAEHHEGREHAT